MQNSISVLYGNLTYSLRQNLLLNDLRSITYQKNLSVRFITSCIHNYKSSLTTRIVPVTSGKQNLPCRVYDDEYLSWTPPSSYCGPEG